jgi:hypothetical protein
MDSGEVDKRLADELRLKHWDCTLMFDVAGLEGTHDILQYVKPNPLSKDAQTVMECIAKGYTKHCMMKFPEVYSGEMMWGVLKSDVFKAGEEQGYSLRGTQCDKSTVTTKSAKTEKPILGWTYSLGCYHSRLYQSRQASFLNFAGNEMFEQGNKVTLMKGNRKIEQRGPIGKTLSRKTTTTLPLDAEERCPFRISIYYFKPDGYYYLSTNGNIHNFDKGITCSHCHRERQTVVFLAAVWTWTSTLR